MMLFSGKFAHNYKVMSFFLTIEAIQNMEKGLMKHHTAKDGDVSFVSF